MTSTLSLPSLAADNFASLDDAPCDTDDLRSNLDFLGDSFDDWDEEHDPSFDEPLAVSQSQGFLPPPPPRKVKLVVKAKPLVNIPPPLPPAPPSLPPAPEALCAMLKRSKSNCIVVAESLDYRRKSPNTTYIQHKFNSNIDLMDIEPQYTATGPRSFIEGYIYEEVVRYSVWVAAKFIWDSDL